MLPSMSFEDPVEGFIANTFGFGLGRLNLRLADDAFRPGDTIRGRIDIKLRAPTEGQRLILKLFADQWVASVRVSEHRQSGGPTSSSTGLSHSKRRVFEFVKELDGHRTYTDGEGFDFALKIPDRAGTAGESARPADNPLAKIAYLVQDAMTPLKGDVRWYLDARLVFGWFKKDLSKKLQILIEP